MVSRSSDPKLTAVLGVGPRAATARLALDMLGPADVGDVAAAALAAGMDSPALRRLAASADNVWPDPCADLIETLDGVGLRIPSRQEAARSLGEIICRRIAAHDLDPFEGTQVLAAIDVRMGSDFHDFDLFIYAESEAEDRPEDRNLFAGEILKEAQRRTK